MSDAHTLYDAQFFGFTPQTFLLRLYTGCQESLSKTMVCVEEALLEKFAAEAAAATPSLVRRGTEQFLAFASDRFNALFSQMEGALRRTVLSVPDNVLLPEDEAQEQAAFMEEKEEEGALLRLQEEVSRLEERLGAERRAAEALEAELEEQRAVRPQLERMLQWLQSLEDAGREEGGSSLREGMQAVTQAALQLQDAVKGAEGKLASLEDP